MRHAVGEVEEKGSVGRLPCELSATVCFNKLNGFIGVAPRDGALVNGMLEDFFVFNQRGFPDAAFFGVAPILVPFTVAWAFGVCRVTHVIGVGNAEVGIKSLGGWKEFRVVTEVPFTHTRGGVALGLEHVRDGSFPGVKANIIFGEKYDPRIKHTPWVAAGHQGRS